MCQAIKIPKWIYDRAGDFVNDRTRENAEQNPFSLTYLKEYFQVEKKLFPFVKLIIKNPSLREREFLLAHR